MTKWKRLYNAFRPLEVLHQIYWWKFICVRGGIDVNNGISYAGETLNIWERYILHF